MFEHELGVIGCGNMAGAVGRGALASGYLTGRAITVYDVDAAKAIRLASACGLAVAADNKAAASCRRVLFAVKPQDLRAALLAAAPAVSMDATIISVAAGVPAAAIDGSLGGRGGIVRVMPNTPLLVGCGASAIAAGPRAGEDDLAWAERLFASAGAVIRVDEALLDAVTAVSGSGPAYFFYLVEAMIAAGSAEGLPPDTAAALAAQTCLGAAKMLLQSGLPPEELRRRVTSPNGTTQKAVDVLKETGVFEAFIRAIRAAARRSRELGGPR